MSLEKRTREAADAIVKIVNDLENSSRLNSHKVMQKLGRHIAERWDTPAYTTMFFREASKGAAEAKEKAGR